MQSRPGPDETLASVERTLEIVEALWRLDEAGVTELANELGMAKSTVHSHLATLRRKGYVVKEGDSYALSLRFLTFGEHVKRTQRLYHEASAIVEELAEETGEHTVCMTEQNGLGTVLCAARGNTSMQSNITVGTPSFLHCSAGGKAMLAHMSDQRVDSIIDRWGLKRFTEHTITDRDELYRELDAIRERGIAYNREEYLENVNAIGAAITSDDSVLGSLSVSGPAHRFEAERIESEITDALLSSLNIIEVNLQLSSR